MSKDTRETKEAKDNSRLKGAADALKKQEKREKPETKKTAKEPSRLKGAAEAVKGQEKLEKPVKPQKKAKPEKKTPEPVKKEWPKGPLTTQQKIYYYGGLALRAVSPLLLYMLMPSLCLSLGYVFGGHNSEEMSFEEFFTYGANFYTTVGTFLTLWILHKRAKRRGSTIWEESTLFAKEMKPLRATGFFVFGFASAIAVSALLTLMPECFLTRDYTAATQKMYLGRDLIFMLGTILLLAPVVEEIIFRGHMLNTFLEHIPERTAVLITSIIFAVMHSNVIWVLYSFGLGQILAKTSMKEDNIAYGVLLHIGFNATAVVNYFIMEDAAKAEALFGSKALIALYGVLGLAISLFLASVYTDKLDLKMLWRRVTGR